MADLAVGIDLGTTNSCVAYYVNGQVKILENSEGGRVTPSVLFFTEKNATIVGEYAKKMSTAKPEYGVYEIKRLVGRKLDDPYVQNNLKYFPFKLEENSSDPIVLIDHPKQTLRKTPTELCAAILAKIKKDVEEKLGQSVEKAVITVPAYFNISQREATLAAGNQAGFTVLKLLNEPTAAALSYYLENDCETENYSLVYDLGGGTFDVAILKRSRRNIDIVCVDGDSHLGGQDFDNLIKDHVCSEIQKRYSYKPMNDRRAMRRLHNHCEEAKKTLSVTDETTIFLHGFVKNQDTVEISLTRAQFEAMADKYFKKTINIIDNCLKSSNLDKSAIKEVILSGGSTRIPKIQQMLSDYFGGKNLNKFVNPDECVAEGAAVQAAMLSTSPCQQITEVQITDVTPLSLGLRSFVDVMTILIKRNTPIPATESSTRVTVYDKQKTMTFNIYEGERRNAQKNRCLGTMTIKDITPAPPGQCEVIFTMTLDQNGILTVTAQEKYKENVKDLKVVYSRGHRSDSEVKNALEDAENNKEEDRKFVEFASQKEYLLNYCIRCIYNFESKNLVDNYKDSYKLCQTMKTKAEKTDVKNEANVKKMIQEIKQRCPTMKAVTVLLVLLPLALGSPVLEERTRIPVLNENGEIELQDLPADFNPNMQPFVSASDVEFDLYTRNSRLSPLVIKNGNVNALSGSVYDPSKLNVFVVHGWTNSRSSEINILLRGGIWNGGWDVNLFIVDWNAISRKDYVTARYSTREVGVQIGNFISQIQRVYGVGGSQFVLIGHSLGAHIVGSAGASSNDKPGLVVGLDPAGPLFVLSTSRDRLDPTDGQIVEVMHTDGDTLGIGTSLGDIDYYPNGGDDQPGCILDVTGICAHARAYKYLAESIERGGGFVARKCSTWSAYRLGLCRSNESSNMGLLRGSGSSSGEYYLETNSRSPYGQN